MILCFLGECQFPLLQELEFLACALSLFAYLIILLMNINF